MSKSIMLLILALLLLAAGIGWYVINNPAVDSAEVAKANKAVRLAALANGALENESYAVGEGPDGKLVFGFDEAIPRYEELKSMYPEETLPYRNLALARMLQLTAASSQNGEEQTGNAEEMKRAAQESAIAAIQSYLQMEDLPTEDEAVGHWMQGHMLNLAGAPKSLQPKILEELIAAAELQPKMPRFWFAIVSLIESLQLENPKEMSDALKQLRELEPRNLVVILYSLKDLAEHDPEALSAYWQEVKPELERANLIIQNYKGTEQLSGNATDLIQQIEAAIEAKENQQVVGLTINLINSVKSKDPYKVDISRLTANPLDFLQKQFSEKIQSLVAEETLAFDADSTQATFKAFLLENAAQSVTDFTLIDVNFDGVLDAIVLGDKQLKVLAGPLDATTAEVIVDHPLSGSFEKLVAAHLLMVPDGGSGVSRQVREANDVESTQPIHLELPHIVLAGQDGLSVLKMTWEKEAGFGVEEVPQPEELTIGGIRDMKLLDYDQDADLDLAIATDSGFRLLMNRTNLTFMDVSEWFAGDTSKLMIKQMEVVDWDRDVDVDLVALTDDGEMVVLQNHLYGRFSSTPINDVPKSVSAFALAELDGNASWDLVVQSPDGTTLVFTETRPWGDVTVLPSVKNGFDAKLVGAWQIADFDNDLTFDLLVGDLANLASVTGNLTGSSSADVTKRFAFSQPGAAVNNSSVTEGAVGDLDGDGLQDVVLLTDGILSAAINQASNENRWLEILPRGKGDNVSKANHLGLGSLFEVRVGDRYFATTVQLSSVHVGLGHHQKADLARIVWPNGIPQTLLLQEGNQRIEMVYILKGSCPFIYTWDGQDWQFYSDCLWAAPIGLQSAGGGLVPTRNWEYLRIDGDRMQVTDGTYRLMLTEELWETAYFDYVQLQVIDHPVGWEIQTNDKVGPPSIVQHRLYAYQERRPPVAATDSDGNDVLSVITSQDQVYFKGFTGRYAQGFVDPHYLQLELDDQLDADSTLFLTGWIQPTDTSINVLLRDHPGTDGPQFPWLEVIGENGEWTKVDRVIGFPGGKTKTMALPLNDLFPTDDHRLRLHTSCEIYWDQVFVAQTPQSMTQQLQIHDCSLVSATHRFRGTSRRLPAVENGPEEFDASDVTSVSVWPPVHGPFTSYGDVLSLVKSKDDRMTVLGTGDAVELQFQSPGDVPEGMQRTFLFYSVGYDKDADLNTVAGQTSLPLPFDSMKQYPEDQQVQLSVENQAGSKLNRSQSWYRFWHQVSNPEVVSQPNETKVPVISN